MAMLEIVNEPEPVHPSPAEAVQMHALEAMLREITERSPPAAAEPPPAKPTPDRDHQILGIMNLLATLLTVRLALVLAVVGAFVLAMMTVRNPQPGALWALGIFCSSLIPLSWLVSRRVS